MSATQQTAGGVDARLAGHRDAGTSVVLAGLTVFNAVIALRQEAKAEQSVKALAQMMKTIARVRRDGQAIEVDAAELEPGDVVLMKAGNRVPRIFETTELSFARWSTCTVIAASLVVVEELTKAVLRQRGRGRRTTEPQPIGVRI